MTHKKLGVAHHEMVRGAFNGWKPLATHAMWCEGGVSIMQLTSTQTHHINVCKNHGTFYA